MNGTDLADRIGRHTARRPPPGAVGQSRRRAHRRCPHVDMALTAAKEALVTDPLVLLVGMARVPAHV